MYTVDTCSIWIQCQHPAHHHPLTGIRQFFQRESKLSSCFDFVFSPKTASHQTDKEPLRGLPKFRFVVKIWELSLFPAQVLDYSFGFWKRRSNIRPKDQTFTERQCWKSCPWVWAGKDVTKRMPIVCITFIPLRTVSHWDWWYFAAPAPAIIKIASKRSECWCMKGAAHDGLT